MERSLNSFDKLWQELTLVSILEKKIEQEIVRLRQSELVDWEKEKVRLVIYQQLVYEI